MNSFFPPFPGLAYERMFTKLLPTARLKPLSAYLALTQDCPANCWHCSIKNRQQGELLGRKEWLSTINQLNALETSLIGFTGGEPLLRKDLPELVKGAHHGGAEVLLFTSGIGATEERFGELEAAGLWAVGVSLDHTDPQVVNRLRGTSNAYSEALTALRLAKNLDFYTFINAVASRQAVECGEHQRLLDLATRLQIHELRFIEPMPCGRLAGLGSDAFLEPSHVAMLRQFHRSANRETRGPKVCVFSEIESPELFGCVAGTAHLYIDPCGNVCPCDFVPLSFGNIKQESIEVIWKRMSRAIGQPRCQCMLQENSHLFEARRGTHPLPLSPELSCQIAAEMPETPLPGFFEAVSSPLGFFAE